LSVTGKNIHQCNHCTQVFTRHRDLMQHTIKEHQSCELICPWCVSSERLFRYPADLSRHVQRQHPSLHQTMPPRTMTAANCFYYSQVPAQYLTLFVAVSLFTSPESKFAMDSVARWCTGRTPGASHWMKGWQLAKSTNTSSKKSSSSFPSSTTQSPSSTTSKTSTSTPAPSSHHFSIKAVEISNESSKIFLASETHLYQARLLQHARGRPTVIATLATLAATPREKIVPPPASKFEVCQDSTIKKAISTHLCLSEIDLSAIRHMAFSFKRALPSTTQFDAKNICPSPFPPSAPSTPQPTPTITAPSPLPDHRPSSTSSIDELKTPSPFSFGCPSPLELPTITAPPFIPTSMPSLLSSSPVTA